MIRIKEKVLEIKYMMAVPSILTILMVFSAIIYCSIFYSKVFFINDNAYVLSLMNDETPGSMYIEDATWGMSYISNEELMKDFYQYMMSLPLVSKQSDIRKNNDGLKGTIYLTSGNSVSFDIGEYIYIDGIAHGSELSRVETKSYANLLKGYLYNTENLANMVNAQRKIQIRIKTDRKTLGMNQKREFKEIIQNGKSIQNQGKLRDKVEKKGEVLCQIEFYDEELTASPEVYMIAYSNGLCMVFDSIGNQSGSIMQLEMDLEHFCEEMEK